MRIASSAQNLVSGHPQGAVRLNRDILFCDGLPEARPAGAGFELGPGIEKNRITADAMIQPVRVVAGVLAGERPLGPGLARHHEFLGRQLLFPFG